MKLLAVLILYLLISPAGCKDKNIQPNFPVRLSPSQKAEISKKWDKGKLLFKANCAKCHGVFTKGKDSIPNFSKVKMDLYATRFLARDPKNHAVMAQLYQEDFNTILVFLTYLKKKGQNATKPIASPHSVK